jgi:hypothetical protein
MVVKVELTVKDSRILTAVPITADRSCRKVIAFGETQGEEMRFASVWQLGLKGIVPVSEAKKHQQTRTHSNMAVPVLFTLRNVQPAIFAGTISGKSTKDGTVAKTDPPSATLLSSKASGLGGPGSLAKAAQDTPPAAESTAVRTPSRVRNRIYNGSIALLVLVLLGLVINNSRKNSTGSSDQLAVNPAASASTTKVELVSQAPAVKDVFSSEPKVMLGFPNAAVGPSLPQDVQTPIANNSDLKASVSTGSEPILKPSLALGNPMEPALANPASQMASPPMLLSSREVGAATTSVAKPIPQLAQASNMDSALPPNGVSIADRKSSVPNYVPSSTQEELNGADARATYISGKTPPAIETRSPELNMSDLLSAYQRAHGVGTNGAAVNTVSATNPQGYGQVPYVPVAQQSSSGMQPQGGPFPSQVLGGQTYPAMTNDPSATLPAYEQNARNNRMIGNPINPSDMTNASRGLQASAAGNRYQGTLIQQPQLQQTQVNAPSPVPTQKTPYTSLGTPSSVPSPTVPGNQTYTPLGNSVGYPPSN